MISRFKAFLRPAPPPPRSPSLEYLPATVADRKRDLALGSMYPLRRATGVFHPDLPLHPDGYRPMTENESRAARDFKARYQALGREAEAAGRRDRFDALEYKQTYRREGDAIVANQPGLIAGTEWGIPRQSGLYPAGTVVDIHSHPNIPRPGNDIPSETDHRSAHRARTNALHRPGTSLDGCLMYDPITDAFFGYTGAPAGDRGKLAYHRLYDPFPAPGQGNAPHTPGSPAWGGSPTSSVAGSRGHGALET